MAALNENDTFPEEIYRLEQDDPVLGGEPNEETGAGMDNIPHLQLAKRTRWLKTRVDQILQKVGAATTAVAGIVRLSNSLTSTSQTMAATSAAVKGANDNANSRVPKAIFEDGLRAQQSGYQDLPGGLCIQWTFVYFDPVNGADGQLAPLPKAFPNAILHVQGTDNGAGARSIGVTPAGKNQVRFWARNASTGDWANTGVRILAIGY